MKREKGPFETLSKYVAVEYCKSYSGLYCVKKIVSYLLVNNLGLAVVSTESRLNKDVLKSLY